MILEPEDLTLNLSIASPIEYFDLVTWNISQFFPKFTYIGDPLSNISESISTLPVFLRVTVEIYGSTTS